MPATNLAERGRGENRAGAAESEKDGMMVFHSGRFSRGPSPGCDERPGGPGKSGSLTVMNYVDINILESMSRAKPVSFAMTLKVRDCCLCLHVQRAARALARRFDAELRPLGLTNGQFSLLMSLNRPEAPGMAAVADLLAMDRTTLTAALKPLERRGMVQVATDPADRRGRRLRLTAKGMKLLAEAAPVWERTHAEMERLLGDGEPDRLRRGLRALE
jgi:DNA-binding MarR family transcriptional regulator